MSTSAKYCTIFLSFFSARPAASNCCKTFLITLPEPLLNFAGLWPLLFFPPYLVLNLETPIGLTIAIVLNIAAARTYHQSLSAGGLSLCTPVFA